MLEIHQAAKSGDIDKVKRLISEGHNVNELDKHQYTSLIYAATENNTQMVNFLLDEGADVNLGPAKFNAIFAAANHANLEMLKRLLAANPDLSEQKFPNLSILIALIPSTSPFAKEARELLLTHPSIRKSYEKDLLSEQGWLIKRMGFLDYPIDNDGMCRGIALMALQAFLSNDLARYLERLVLISQMPNNKQEFVASVEQLKNKRLALIAEVKTKNNLRQLRNLTPSEALLIQDQIAVIEQRLNKLKLSLKERVERKRQMEYVAFTQLKINEKLNALPHRETILLEIPNFFDGVATGQDIADKKYLFPSAVLMQDEETATSIIGPVLLDSEENKTGIKKILNFSSFYSKDELTQYFESMADIQNNDKIALMLSNLNHVIFAGFDPEAKCYILIDPSHLDWPTTINSPSKMATLVEKALESRSIEVKDGTLMVTRLYSSHVSMQAVQKFADDWIHHEKWKKLDDPQKIQGLPQEIRNNVMNKAILEGDVLTIKKLKSTDVDISYSLIFAIRYGTLAAIDEILLANIEVATLSSALLLAVVFDRIDVMEKLIDAGANPNTLYNPSMTLLMFAAFKSDYAKVELLLKKGANIDVVINKNSAFSCALLKKDFQMIEMLLNRSCQVTPEDRHLLDQLLEKQNSENSKNPQISKTEFMRAWVTVYPPKAIDLRQLQGNDPAYDIYTEAKKASGPKALYVKVMQFTHDNPNHPLAKQLMQILAEKNSPSPTNKASP